MMRIGDLDLAEKSIEENLNIAPCDRFAAMDEVRDTPTIDPETLPIVRELREELQRVTVERDAAVADCFKFMDSKGLVSVLVKNEKGQKVSRAIWFFEYEGWIGLIRRK